MLEKSQLTATCINCKAKNAIIGDISSIPPIGGIIPRNMFKNGSVSDLMNANGWASQSMLGIQVKNILIINNK